MKANEAPERIWIDPTNDLPKLSGHIDKDSVEYIRKDAFIEKASKWIVDNFPTVSGISALMYADDFKKAMRV